jgi:conjugal transfer pilus assembly protein TraD
MKEGVFMEYLPRPVVFIIVIFMSISFGFLCLAIGLTEFDAFSVTLLTGVMYFMFFKKFKKKKSLPFGDPRTQNNIDLHKRQTANIKKNNTDITLEKHDILLAKQDIDGKDFIVKDKEMNAMCFICGTTGSGKTTAINTMLETPIKEGFPIVCVDGKGSPSFHQKIERICNQYNRNFKLFNISDTQSSWGYNPLSHGGYTELKDKIISLFDWSEEHYKSQAERFLQGFFKLMLMPEVKRVLKFNFMDMHIMTKCLNEKTIMNICKAIPEKADFMLQIMSEIDMQSNKGLLNRIKNITESEIGELFKVQDQDKRIDLLESLNNNDVVFFSLNSLRYPEFAKMVGRIVIADLKTVSTEMYGLDKKIYTCFDEFNIFASDIIVNLINKTREYGFRNIVATQELADLVIDGQRKLLDQIWGNTNVKIAMRQEVVTSQEELAKAVSVEKQFKITISDQFVQDGLFNPAGMKGYSSTLQDEFIYEPKEFGQLQTGEAIVFIKHPEFRHSKVKIRRV